jgi:hypothetical protein
LIPKTPDDWPPERPIEIHGVGLTASGKKLMGIVQIEHDVKYLAGFRQFIDFSGFGIARVGESYILFPSATA